MNLFDTLLAGKIAGGGAPEPTLIEKNITANGSYQASADEADGYSAVTVDVPNSYGASDEGKVVSNGALVAQTATSASTNGTIDTTTHNSVVISVPNTYSAGDEGKVVHNGALTAQTSTSVSQNGTIDTTLNNSVTVQVPEGAETGTVTCEYSGSSISDQSVTKNGDIICATWKENGTNYNNPYVIPRVVETGSTLTMLFGAYLYSGQYTGVDSSRVTIDGNNIKLGTGLYVRGNTFFSFVIHIIPPA